MDRLKQMALAQKARLLESLSAPQNILHAIVEGDKNVTRVVIDGEGPRDTSSSPRLTTSGADAGPSSPAGAPSGGDFSASSNGGFYSTEMVCAILRAVEESRVVTHLTIANRSDASEFISSLTPVLSKNLVLKGLKIEHVDMGDDLSMALFGALSKNTAVETVALNDIGLTATHGLCLLLRHAHAIKTLDISDNALTADAFASLAEGLRAVTSTELREIKLANTNATDADIGALCSALEESVDYCPSLRVLDVGASSSASDATRSRLVGLTDQRIAKAAEGFRASVSASVVNPNRLSDKASDRISGSGVADERGSTASGRGANDAFASETVNEQSEAERCGSSSPPASSSPPLQPSSSSSFVPPPVASSSTGGISQAELNAAVAAAVAAATKEHTQRAAKLSELLGDSQAQAARLQSELKLRDERIGSLQEGAAATKEATKAMHQQFQKRVFEAEEGATSQLKEAAEAITSLQARLKELTARATQQGKAAEESVAAHARQCEVLTAENKTLREEYLSELRAAIEAQRSQLEAAKSAPPIAFVDAEVQTDDVVISGDSDLADGGEGAAAAAAAAAARARTLRSSTSANALGGSAYEEAVSGFAFVDADDAEDDVTQSRWKRDIDVSHCVGCRKEFTTLTRRKHHCRRCGDIFCGDCILKSKVDGKAVCNNCSRSETVMVAKNAARK